MKLPAAVYTAHRGYAWSNVPAGIQPAELDTLVRFVSEARGDFPDPLSVETGLVSNGRIAAAFTMQNVANWDANGRAADYGAFVFFPVELSRVFDLVTLVNKDFFWTPSHTPASSLEYAGPASSDFPSDAVGMLKRGLTYRLAEPRALGSLLSAHGTKSDRWTCLMQADGTLEIACAPWSATHP